jgi:hypothetical protein
MQQQQLNSADFSSTDVLDWSATSMHLKLDYIFLVAAAKYKHFNY